MKLKTFNKIYLDNASATPIDKKVLGLMYSYDKKYFANATSIHKGGLRAREIIEESRTKIAKEFKCHPDEIIFTGSSTESNAMVILGIINNYQLKNKTIIPHVITTEIEHPAVLMNFKRLEKRGSVEVTYLKIDERGMINLKELKESLKDNTSLVSVMYANNEIGTIQPIQEIAKIIRHFKKENSSNLLFHTDATQAMNYLYTENIEKLGVDLMSFNGSKIYGPKGVGVLYKKRGIKLSPIYAGGDQEFGLRSGTENVSSIAGLALALQITNKIKEKEVERLIKIRNYCIDKLLAMSSYPFLISLNGDKENRLPNNINISILGISSELLVLELDSKGVEVSSKSACKSDEKEEDSYVINAIRRANNNAIDGNDGSLRITLGRYTKKSDIDKFLVIFSNILEKYKKWK